MIFVFIAWAVWESAKLSEMLNLSTNLLRLPKAWFQWSLCILALVTAFGMLLRAAEDINWSDFDGAATLGISAGASAPEILVDEVVAAFCVRFDVTIEDVRVADENMFFKLPRELRGGEMV